jgi:ABC-2 type transport system permease protein
MGKFWAVFKREYLERVRTRWFIISTIFGPILLGAAMIVPAWMSARSVRDARVGRVEIIDATGVSLGRVIQGRLLGPAADTGSLTVRELAPAEVAAAESVATQAVMAKSLTGYLVIDSATVAGRSARYAGSDASSVGSLERLEGAIRQAVLARRLEGEGLDPARIEALTQVRVQLASERITSKGRGGSGRGAVVVGFIVAFLLYMSLVLYGQNMLRSVLEEKTTRVAEVIVASVKTDILLAGKVVGVAAVGLTQQVAWIASAALIWTSRGRIFSAMGIPSTDAIALPNVGPMMIVLYLAFFVLGFVFYSSLFAAAGATVNSDQEAGQAAQPIIMLLVFSILFLQPVLLAPTSTMSKVLSWLPFSAPIVMPLRMSVVSISALELTAVLAGLVAACFAAIWVSARIYRVGLLMYGKRPSFRELGRWIAQA